MGRRPRQLIRHGLYHIVGHTARRLPVFADAQDTQVFLDLVATVVQRDGWSVHAWCVLPDCYHLVLHSGEVPLPRSMRLIQGRFAQLYNQRHASLGPVWQGRYLAHLMAEDEEMAPVMAWVHLRPVAAGLVAEPSAWTLSGHRALLGSGSDPLLGRPGIEGPLDSEVTTTSTRYAAALTEVASSPCMKHEVSHLPWWQRGQAHQVSVSEAAAPLSVDEFLDRACRSLGLPLARLASRRRDSATAQARELVATLAVERHGLRAVDLARALDKHPDWVSRWASQGAARRASDPAYAAEYERLHRAVSGTPEPAPDQAPDKSKTWEAWLS